MAEPGRDSYRTELEGIKAPLGVILYLIRRDNLDIYDIPIAKITKEYLNYLDLMEQCNIELAGEFFVLAATLMRIKIQMLLRRGDEEEDPRERLVRSLLEYQKMLEAARSLKSMEEDRLKIYARAVPEHEREIEPEVELELNLYELMKAFREIAANFEEAEVTEIEPERVTIEEKIDTIFAALSKSKQVTFSGLFSQSSSRLELVVTFIALLELIKRCTVSVRQDGAFGNIWLYLPDNISADEAQKETLDATDSCLSDTPRMTGERSNPESIEGHNDG